MNVYKNLKPHVRTMEFLGGTGDGKTEAATVAAEPKARKILLKGVGQTNSTLRERLFVYTADPEFKDKIVVCVTLEDDILSRSLFTELIVKAWAKLIKDSGKAVAFCVGRDEEQLAEFLYDEISKKNNVKAILSFLSDEKKDEFVNSFVALYTTYKMHEKNYAIYNTVKNSLPETETKATSKKFLAGIQSEVGKQLDMMSDEFKANLWEEWRKVNAKLKDVFFSYFDEESKSEDGYFYKEIMLDSPNEEFISAMFTSNDLQGGERLSLEVMCEEINIYVPMNPIFEEKLQKVDVNGVFSDSFGNKVFGVLDTRGLYHADNTEDENADYCTELVFRGDIDALVMVVPLFGDSNEKKISELYRDVIKNFNKQIPVIMLHNKVDLFVDSLNKDNFDDDPLSMDMGTGKELSVEEIDEAIKKRESELIEDLQEVQSKARKNLRIKSLSCYLKRDQHMQEELVQKYNVSHAYSQIFGDMAEYLKDSAYKISLTVKPGEEIVPTIDNAAFTAAIHCHVIDPVTEKKVFTPGMSDLALSIGKTPHGNAYHALSRRLKMGDGYTSNIDESYFYNCNSFSINFTANMRNFATPELIHKLVYSSVRVNGGKFQNQEEHEKFIQIVENNVNPKKLVSALLFYSAIHDAEKTAFSFKGKFQNFLQNAMQYFNVSMINEAQYTEALKGIILEATERALSLNVTYK